MKFNTDCVKGEWGKSVKWDVNKCQKENIIAIIMAGKTMVM